MGMTIEVSSELHDRPQQQQQQQQPLESVSSHGKRTVRGVVIPPLNLQSPMRQDDESQEQHPRPAHPGRRRTALLNGGPPPAMPGENAISGSATATPAGGGNHGVGAGRQRHSHSSLHLPAHGHGVGRGDGRRGSSVADEMDVETAATLPTTASGIAYLPDGVEASMTEEEKASREAIAVELGTSYATRAYKEHLRSHNYRQPGLLERIPTPTEEQTRQNQHLNQMRSADVARAPHQSQSPAHPQAQPYSHSHAHTHTYANPHGRHISARYSNGDARSSTSTTLPGVSETPASPRHGSARQSSSSATADLEGALPLHLSPQIPQHHTQHGGSSSGQQPQDTPRSFLAQPSSRSATSDGRLGTAASSIGMADMEAEIETPPPPPPPPAAARGADGIETLDEVMAPGLRERIRQLLSAQDALLAHQARMRAYEEEREKAVRARQAAASHTAAHIGASGTRRGGLRSRHISNRNYAARNTRHSGGGDAGRKGRLTSRSTSPVMFRKSAATVLSSSPTAAAATFVLAGKATAPSPAAQAATMAELPLLTARVTLPAMQPRMSSAAVSGRISPDGSPGPPTAAAMGPATAASGRLGRSMSLAASRSLKRVQLVTTKNDKAKGTEKGKDKKKERKRGARKGKSSSSSVSRSSNSESSSGSSSESSSSSDSSSSDGEGRSSGATSPSPRAPPARTTSSSAAVASGPFGTAAAAATAATAASGPAAAAAPAPAANANVDAATAGAAQAPTRQHDSSTSEASLTPQASSASVHTGSGTSGTRSYGGGSTRPGRSSMRASVPPPQRIVLPGPQGDLNHLMLLLEKLPSKTPRAKPPLSQVPALGMISPPRGSSAGALTIPDLPKSLSPDHRQRLSLQIQHLHLLPRSNSPNGRFSYDIGEPSVWGEAIAQAALNGFPSGAAATTLARCEEKLPACHKGSLSPVASTLLLATAEPTGLIIQPSSEHQTALGDRGPNMEEAAPEVAAEMAIVRSRGPRRGSGSGDGEAEAEDIPLAVKVMMGYVSECDTVLETWPASLPSLSKFSPGLTDPQRSVMSVTQHPQSKTHRHHHHHHRRHHHHHHRSHRQENSMHDLHDLHEFHGSQLRLHRNHGHVHKHHPNNSSQEGQDADPGRRQSEGAGYGSSHGGNVGRAGHNSPPLPSGRLMDRPYNIDNDADDGGTGGGDVILCPESSRVGSRGRSHGAGSSDAEDLDTFDPAWKALRERRRLPPEALLPARMTCPATTARDGGGAHSFGPEQVAAMASVRAVGSLTGGISGARLSGSGAAGPSSSSVSGAAVSMPSLLRVAPPPPPVLTAPALVRGGGGALLPGLGVRSGAAAAAERGRAHAMSGTAGGCSTGDVCNSPVYELYALGLLPNPSLLRASMASTTTRPNGPLHRRHPGFTAPTTFSGCAAAAAASILGYGDLQPRFCSSSTASVTAGAAASFSSSLPQRLSRQELGPISAHSATFDASRGAGGGGAGRNGSGAFSAPSSPKPSIYVHTHPHVIPGSVLKVAEAAEAEVMQARSKMGRSSALDLQHMLGVNVPPPMLQAR
ncbi:hypothetical protein Vafri_17697 [Volvox africanus]|uniref:Uncharacterized protein n=1 Tax=Volvox africanus TaxID=51714 RepID=A0A8J4F6X0_9CHLO|nr:hypothetical protein Vafri_17697 [Volvox africanus]